VLELLLSSKLCTNTQASVNFLFMLFLVECLCFRNLWLLYLISQVPIWMADHYSRKDFIPGTSKWNIKSTSNTLSTKDQRKAAEKSRSSDPDELIRIDKDALPRCPKCGDKNKHSYEVLEAVLVEKACMYVCVFLCMFVCFCLLHVIACIYCVCVCV
jgi:hypothetical protein